MSGDPPPIPESEPLAPPPLAPPAQLVPGRWGEVVYRLLVLASNLAAFVAFAAVTVILSVGAMSVMGVKEPTGEQTVFLSGAMLLVIAGFTVAWTAWLGGPVDEGLGWSRNTTYGTPALIAIGAVLAPLGVIVSILFPSDELSPIQKVAEEAFLSLLVLAIAVAPVAEETIFRGFLFRIFKDAVGPAAAVVVTSLLFALVHVSQLSGNLAAVGVILLIGAVLGFLRLRSGSIIPGIVVHFTYNAGLFFLALWIDFTGPK